MSEDATSTDSLLHRDPPTSGYFRARRWSCCAERWHVVAFCALTACLSSLVAGMSFSFSSIIINELSSSTFQQWKIDSSGIEASLIGSLLPAGATLGGFLAWPVADYLGRQAALIIGGVPGLIGWLVISLSILFSSRMGFLLMLYVGRVLTGISTGWSVYCASVYISEISSAKYRGLFGNCVQFFVTIGILFSFVLGIEFNGHRVSFYKVALIAAGLITFFEIAMLFTFETPRWLFGKQKDEQGENVLRHLRGPDADIEPEIDNIKGSLKKLYTVLDQLKEFRSRSVYQPFLLVLGLMFFQQFCGITAATYYSSSIFKDAGFEGNRAEVVATLANGVPTVIVTFLSVLLVDRLGRRVLLLTSSLGMMLSSVVMAVYFALYQDIHHCDSKSDLLQSSDNFCDKIGYMALGGFVVFISSFSIGWGPIPWTAFGELLPNKVRALAGSMASIVSNLGAVVVTLTFAHYTEAVTPKFTWVTFAVVMLFSIVFVFLFLPETKGRSLEEIQENFEHGHILAIRCRGQKHGPRLSPERVIN